jgi:peroxiredoxin
MRPAVKLCLPFLALLALTGVDAAAETPGFAIVAEGLEGRVGEVFEIRRESLAERREEAVTSRTLEAPAFVWSIAAEPGLFLLRAGGQTLRFVAADGDQLRLRKIAGATGEGPLELVGSPAQDAFRAYEAFRLASLARTVQPVRAALRAAGDDGEEAEIERLVRLEVEASEVHRSELNDFVLATLRDSPAFYASSLRWKGDYRLEELAAAVEAYAARHPGQGIAREMRERIARFHQTQVGALAPELSGVGPDGSPVALADFRGRHVLVDFWASWCPPCRIANRDLARLYREFQPLGWEILAVSVDHQEAAWKRAIARDGAVWTHLGDLQGWSSAHAARFNVTALPASFLLDPEGRVLARDLAPAELEALLERLLRGAEADLASD